MSKARSILEIARLKINSPQLWLCAVRVERRAGNHKAAATLMAKALQQCRNAGTLWAEAIAMEPRAQQKTKSSDALKACDNLIPSLISPQACGGQKRGDETRREETRRESREERRVLARPRALS